MTIFLHMRMWCTGWNLINNESSSLMGYKKFGNKNELAKNYKIFGGMNLISIVPLCFVENIWFSIRNLFQDTEGQIIEVLLLILVVFLSVNMLVTFLISLSSFMKARADTYRLLLMLGISRKDFWKLLLREYCASTIFLVLVIVLGSQALGLALTRCIFGNAVGFSIQEDFFNICILFQPGLLWNC